MRSVCSELLHQGRHLDDPLDLGPVPFTWLSHAGNRAQATEQSSGVSGRATAASTSSYQRIQQVGSNTDE
jgi:hypothetical protein